MSKFEPYNHKNIEDRIYKYWEKNNCFKPKKNKNKKYFSIVIPPPNVTGSLHMGHALNNSIQDLLIRHNRNKGLETLWQPGTDHAGIATQLVVEKQLMQKGVSRKDIGRDKFLKEVWKWKEKSGGIITDQLKKLGSSCDWSRDRFTMDDGLSKAVLKVFVNLYEKKLIYKDFKLTNWDTKLQTAISDLEVVQKETKGKLYYIKYKVVDSDQNIIIATTRPETMFGDTAIAVNPKDKRYQNLIAKEAIIPISNRRIKIISDEYADPDQGSGAVKITPGHDFNDYLVGKRNNLDLINILNKDGTLNENVPKDYIHIDRIDARKKLIVELEQKNFLDKIEDINHTVPYGDRTNSVIEPLLTEQWFVNAKKLSHEAIRQVKKKNTNFFPDNWKKTYFQWMENIEPWCISRQLWWGHQIPAWYTEDGKIIVAENFKEAKKIAKKKFKKEVLLKQDPDVLDTWFSSALWPFATLGWPNNKSYELKRFYKTKVLVTGFDIIFFWVARMMMMGLYFMKEVPFEHIYVHALVRDEKGQKMSKSKGNVIDPLTIINEFGADALRFTLISMSSPGRDVKLSLDRVKGYRNFITKIWNTFSYCEINNIFKLKKIKLSNIQNPANQWIITTLNLYKQRIKKNINDYRFDEAAKNIYSYIWNYFCDWYIEFSKPLLNSSNKKTIEETKNTLLHVQRENLSILHAFIPFVTEELWKLTDFRKLEKTDLINFNFKKDHKLKNSKGAKDIDYIISFITDLRSIKAKLNISPGNFVDLNIDELPKKNQKIIYNNELIIKKLGRIKNFSLEGVKSKIGKVILFNDKISISFGDDINLEQQISILNKKVEVLENQINSSENKLKNDNFIKKAPKNIISQEKDLLENNKNEYKNLSEIINSLK
ncbi:MAG: valine--tRNA ligase [Pelagibacteraceae bacterium]|nr:MAG: valine--tRNA ligase [alpha proteobacterium HIMB114]